MDNVSGTESGTQENVGGMPAGPEPYNPSGQEMPTNGGNLGTNAAPSPGDVASPAAEEYTMVPNVSGSSEEQVGRILGGPGPSLSQFANMPTPDN
jgi:hypothetical protein